MFSIVKRASIAVAAISLVACATTKTDELTHIESSSMSNKTLVQTRHTNLPAFGAMTAANVQFGLIGGLTAEANGNAMIKKNNISDPAIEISERLAEGLRTNRNVKVVSADNLSIRSKKIEDIVGIYSQYDYILDVRTTGWGSMYFGSDWDNYKVIYQAHARLIDAGRGVLMAEQTCFSDPDYDDTNDAPSYEELESGEGLRRELAKAVDYCTEYIRNGAKFYN